MRPARAPSALAAALALATLLALPAAPLGAQRVFTPADFLAVRTPSSLALSPDGSRVAFAVETIDLARDARPQTVWTVPTRGGASRRIAAGRAPAWSPDGRALYFLSDTGPARLWRVAAAGGAPTPVTAPDAPVDAFALGPDGLRAAVVRTVRDSAGGPRAELAVVTLADGAARAIDLGGLAPSNPAWSPSGDAIAFDARSDVYVVRAAGDSAPRALVQRAGVDVRPAWSPDGKWIAFASGQGERRVLVRLSVVPAAGGAPRELGRHFEGWIASYPPRFHAWGADGRTLYVSGLWQMTHRLYALDVATDSVRVVTPGDAAYWSFALSGDGSRVAFLASGSSSAGDVMVSPTARFAPRALTRLNPELARLRFGRVEPVRWASADGLPVEGLLVYPVGYRAGRRYPLLVQMEGTYGTYDRSFTGRVASDDNAAFPFQQQIFAGRGYAVLLPNPRGSWGYGADFARRALGDFGSGPVADVLAGVDALVARGIADSARMGLMGTGYDAYRTVFALTRTARFRAASADNPVFDLRLAHRDLGPAAASLEALVGGAPAERPDLYDRESPSARADRLTTPLLVTYPSRIAGRVAQGEALRGALARNGTPHDVIAYDLGPPTPGGQLWNPRALALLLESNLAWFDRWLR